MNRRLRSLAAHLSNVTYQAARTAAARRRNSAEKSRGFEPVSAVGYSLADISPDMSACLPAGFGMAVSDVERVLGNLKPNLPNFPLIP
jgi:hypothetical protein